MRLPKVFQSRCEGYLDKAQQRRLRNEIVEENRTLRSAVPDEFDGRPILGKLPRDFGDDPRDLGTRAQPAATAAAPLSGQDGLPLRAYARGADGGFAPFSVAARIGSPAPAAEPPAPKKVTIDWEQELINKADTQRTRWLQNLDAAPASEAPMVPEDLTARPRRYEMAAQVGQPTDYAFAAQMAEIGSVEGFGVLLRVGQGMSQEALRYIPAPLRSNVQIVEIPGNLEREVDPWTQDHGEVNQAGGFAMPAMIDDDDFIGDAIFRGRSERLPEDLRDFSEQGAVNDRNNQGAVAAVAAAAGRPLRENLSYIEGGNVLVGTLPSGRPYAIIGKDNVAITRELLERDVSAATGKKTEISEQQALEAIAKDLGIDVRDLVAVEQPYEFHLDMSLALMGPGVVMLNDAREAARLEEQWLREDYELGKPKDLPPEASASMRHEHNKEMRRWKMARWALDKKIEAIWAEVEQRARVEDITERDLKSGGLEVHRVAADFSHGPRQLNFMNGIKGTNRAGDRFLVSLGGDPRAEKYFLDSIMGRAGSDIHRVYFLDRQISQQSLEDFGGINCRTKVEVARPAATPATTALGSS